MRQASRLLKTDRNGASAHARRRPGANAQPRPPWVIVGSNVRERDSTPSHRGTPHPIGCGSPISCDEFVRLQPVNRPPWRWGAVCSLAPDRRRRHDRRAGYVRRTHRGKPDCLGGLAAASKLDSLANFTRHQDAQTEIALIESRRRRCNPRRNIFDRPSSRSVSNGRRRPSVRRPVSRDESVDVRTGLQYVRP